MSLIPSAAYFIMCTSCTSELHAHIMFPRKKKSPMLFSRQMALAFTQMSYCDGELIEDEIKEIKRQICNCPLEYDFSPWDFVAGVFEKETRRLSSGIGKDLREILDKNPSFFFDCSVPSLN